MKPLAISILKQVIGTLRNICSSYFEAILLAGIFSLAFFGFLRIGEVVQPGISHHTLEVVVIYLDYMQNLINVPINSTKMDQYGKYQSFKEY